MQILKIIAFGLGSTIAYGIIHDQVTVRLCVEYFTIGHPQVFDTNSPTMLALGWGIIATWWLGLPLGILLAIACRAGSSSPKWEFRDLYRAMLILMICIASVSAIGGVIGYLAAIHGWVVLVEPMASKVPKERHVLFLTDLWAHIAAYIGGIFGGATLCIWVWKRRSAKRAANDP